MNAFVTSAIGQFRTMKGPLPLFVARCAGAVGVLLANLLVLQGEGASTAGLFFVLYTIFQIGAVAARFGADIQIVRKYYRLDAAGVEQLFHNAVGGAVLLGALIAPISIGLGAWFAGAWANARGVELLSIFVWLPLFAASSIIFYIYQARHKTVVQTVGTNVLQPWLFLAAYLLARFAAPSVIASHALALAFGVSIAGYVVISAAFAARAGFPLSIEQTRRHFGVALMRERSACALTGLSMQAVGWMPYLLASAVLGPRFAAVFNIVQRVAMLTTFISVAINSIAAPKFAEHASKGRFPEIRRLFWSNTRALALLATLFIGCAIAVAMRFAESDLLVPVVVILMGYWLNCMTSACGYYFQSVAKLRTLNTTLLIAGVALPVAMLPVLKEFGFFGAALSMALSVAGVNLILFPRAVADIRRKCSSEAAA